MPGLNTKDEKLVLTFSEAWQQSGLGRDYLLGALRSGRLRSIKVGRTYRIPKTELHDFIQRELAGK